MFYYSVGVAGTGTESDPYQPNVPSGISYVCAWSSDGTAFIVGTSVEIPGFVEISDLQAACSNFGISYSDVLTWAVR